MVILTRFWTNPTSPVGIFGDYEKLYTSRQNIDCFACFGRPGSRHLALVTDAGLVHLNDLT